MSTCLENLFLLSVLHSAPCHLYTLTHKHMLAHCVDFCSRKKSNRGNYFVINPPVYFTEKFSVETLLIIHSIPNHKLAKAVPLINSFLHKWIATISFHIYFSLWCLLGNVLKGNFHLRWVLSYVLFIHLWLKCDHRSAGLRIPSSLFKICIVRKVPH